MATCAHCNALVCETTSREGAPKNCPCLATDEAREAARYTDEDKKAAREAARVEAFGYCRLTRVEEIMEYAVRCGYKHLGVAFCLGLRREARTFVDILLANGFEVDSVCCKNGGVSKEVIGIKPEEYVNAGCEFEAMCNPAGQAAVLDEAGCQLNILLGLCVGHDTLFIKNSKAPVTVLAAKDRVTGHNPLAPIYTADSYYRKKLKNYVKK